MDRLVMALCDVRSKDTTAYDTEDPAEGKLTHHARQEGGVTRGLVGGLWGVLGVDRLPT